MKFNFLANRSPTYKIHKLDIQKDGSISFRLQTFQILILEVSYIAHIYLFYLALAKDESFKMLLL